MPKARGRLKVFVSDRGRRELHCSNQCEWQESGVGVRTWIAAAGGSSISVSQLISVFERSEIKNFELVAGDVLETVPKYIKDHPELKISLLNIDIDFFEANMCCLENFYDLVMPGGVILLDNYTATHGDTKSSDKFFADKKITIKKFPFALRPCYIIKE